MSTIFELPKLVRAEVEPGEWRNLVPGPHRVPPHGDLPGTSRGPRGDLAPARMPERGGIARRFRGIAAPQTWYLPCRSRHRSPEYRNRENHKIIRKKTYVFACVLLPGACLETSWGLLEPCWDSLGRSVRCFGGPLGRLEPAWRLSWSERRLQGRPGADHGANGGSRTT